MADGTKKEDKDKSKTSDTSSKKSFDDFSAPKLDLSAFAKNVSHSEKRSPGIAIFLFLLLTLITIFGAYSLGFVLLPILIIFVFAAYSVEFIRPLVLILVGLVNVYYSVLVTSTPGLGFAYVALSTALIFFLLLPEELLLFPLILMILDFSASIFIFNPISVLMFIPAMVFVISGKWFLLGLFSYVSYLPILESKGYDLNIYKVLSAFMIIAVLLFIGPTLYYQYPQLFSLSISPVKIQQFLDIQEQAKEKAIELTNTSISASRRFATAFSCLLQGDLACFNKYMKPEQEVVQGEIGLGQQTYIHFQKISYLQDKFLEKQEVIVGSNLKVVDLKNSVSRISFNCNLSNSVLNKNQTKLTQVSASPNEINIRNYNGYYENDIYCDYPRDTNGLSNGTYKVDMIANVSDIQTTSKITNLIMDRSGMDSLIRSYISSQKLSYATITRNELIRRIFPAQISSIYPSGSVVSQAEEGNLLQLNFKTTDDYIVGVSQDDTGLNKLLLKSSVLNNGKGTAKLKEIEFFYILPSSSGFSNITTCKSQNLNVELKAGKTYSFNPCILELNPSWVSNYKNSPTSIEIQIKLTYDYEFKNTMYFEVIPQTKVIIQ